MGTFAWCFVTSQSRAGPLARGSSARPATEHIAAPVGHGAAVRDAHERAGRWQTRVQIARPAIDRPAAAIAGRAARHALLGTGQPVHALTQPTCVGLDGPAGRARRTSPAVEQPAAPVRHETAIRSLPRTRSRGTAHTQRDSTADSARWARTTIDIRSTPVGNGTATAGRARGRARPASVGHALATGTADCGAVTTARCRPAASGTEAAAAPARPTGAQAACRQPTRAATDTDPRSCAGATISPAGPGRPGLGRLRCGFGLSTTRSGHARARPQSGKCPSPQHSATHAQPLTTSAARALSAPGWVDST
jgi:hypothetical protein